MGRRGRSTRTGLNMSADRVYPPQGSPAAGRRDTPRLRLVGAEPPAWGRDVRADAERILRENIRAATMPQTDARWIFALDVAGQLQGGRAALLAPERRRQLVARAVRAGLRSFDANLVIAVVQEAARRGECVTSDAFGGRLAVIGPARTPTRSAGAWTMLAASLTLAGLLVLAWRALVLG